MMVYPLFLKFIFQVVNPNYVLRSMRALRLQFNLECLHSVLLRNEKLVRADATV